MEELHMLILLLHGYAGELCIRDVWILYCEVIRQVFCSEICNPDNILCCEALVTLSPLVQPKVCSPSHFTPKTFSANKKTVYCEGGLRMTKYAAHNE